MLADFYIPTLSNDMKIPVHKNHLGRQILYRSLAPPKNDVNNAFFKIFLCKIRTNKKKFLFVIYYT